ncbi:MAG: hypothetical protein JHC93_01280 [Parachlamydiales bacterium]|nr:hypothetical protein [Parachlamydiales bacterium]
MSTALVGSHTSPVHRKYDSTKTKWVGESTHQLSKLTKIIYSHWNDSTISNPKVNPSILIGKRIVDTNIAWADQASFDINIAYFNKRMKTISDGYPKRQLLNNISMIFTEKLNLQLNVANTPISSTAFMNCVEKYISWIKEIPNTKTSIELANKNLSLMLSLCKKSFLTFKPQIEQDILEVRKLYLK